MADFLTRLAGRTLGLAPTVQPMLSPMYAPGQQFVGAEDAQEGIQDAWGVINRAPTPGAATEYHRREMSLQDGLPDEPPSGNLVGQTLHAPEMLLPLVPMGNQSSVAQARREMPAVQPVPGDSTSMERVEAEFSAGQVLMLRPTSLEDRAAGAPVAGTISLEQSRSSGPQFRRAMGVPEAEGHGGRPQGSPPLQVPEENQPMEAALVSPVVDVLAVRRPAEPKAIRPLQDSSQVGRLGHSYNQGNQREVVPVTHESSAAAPTIQVTIGRIEVRATPPPAPQSQPKRSGPAVMGLEEYLNQRAKGGY